jgi:hypothetical protein
MIELELTRTPHDRRLYRLDGVGTLRLGGFLSGGAIAEAGDGTWRFSWRGWSRRAIDATDLEGVMAGEFAPRDFRRGGTLVWRGRELTLRPVTALREHYVLNDGVDELARVEGKGWGRRPVRVWLDRPDALEPGLLLFTTFVASELAIQAVNAASYVSSTSG